MSVWKWNRRATVALGTSLGVFLVASGCLDETPTAPEGESLPGAPVTVEIQVPWADFGSNLEVFGGFGAPRQLGVGVLALDYAASLNARTLLRFGDFPASVSVVDSTGTIRTDTDFALTGGRLVVRFNRTASTNAGTPMALAFGALQEDWDAASVTWANAVDTIDDQRPWSAAGAGTVLPIATATWSPASGDSAFFQLDSARIALLSDSTIQARGVRVDLETVGYRLEITGVELRLDAVSTFNPDTTVVVAVSRTDLTFVYDPVPAPPADGIRVGGAPSWRSVMDIDIPTVLNGPPELCAVVTCPFDLKPEQVSYAAIVLRSRTSEPAFQPTDSVGLDARPVLSRSALPKAPLGGSLVGLTGRQVAPDLFRTAPGSAVEIPITVLARDLLTEFDPTEIPPPRTIALLSTFEPLSIAFASFFGPGVPEAPILKLIVTVGRSVELP